MRISRTTARKAVQRARRTLRGAPVARATSAAGTTHAPAPAAREPEPPVGEPSIARLVAQGASLNLAVVDVARALLADGQAGEAVSLGYSLSSDTSTQELGCLVLGLSRRTTSTTRIAWRDLRAVGDRRLIAAAGEDWFIAAYDQEPDRAAAVLQDVITHEHDQEWTGTTLIRIARAAFHAEDWEGVRAVVEAGVSAPQERVPGYRRRELEMLADWLPGGRYRHPVPVLASDVRIGVMNYQQPGSASRNVGDWIQTLASLGHLVRHQNLSYVGTDPELVRFVQELADGARQERRLSTAETTVQLVEVQRDGMPLQQLPEPTWMLAFGWFMHPLLEDHYLFPFPESVRPLFISFHVNKPELLTPAAIDYLRRYAPIGCRDWQTVVELHRRGVPAFFSGCMTTTVDTVVPPGDPAGRTAVGYVDYPGAPEGQTIKQSITGIRSRPFAENLDLARSWVQRYATDVHTVLTSRLHCNLPARSVGCEVVFAPKNRSDVRFGGLIDIDDAAFEAIRHGILDKIAAAMELILAGAPEDEVYARWREVCASDVDVAQRRIAEARWDVAQTPEVPELHPGTDLTVVVDSAPGEGPHLESFLRQLADRIPAGTAVVVSGNETLRSPRSAEELGASSGLPVSFVNHSTVHVNELGKRVRADRGLRRQVLLASALRSVRGARRAVVLPLASLLREDLTELIEWDLQGHPLAAPPEPRRARQSASGLARRASSAQGDDAAGALEFLAAAAAAGSGATGAVPFDPVVSLVDPSALADGVGALLVPLMVRYGLTLREALNVVLGDDYEPLPERWATMVHLQTPDPDAALLTYAVGTRPWSPMVTAGQQEWEQQQLR